MYLTLTLNPSIDYYVRFPEGKKLTSGTSEGPALNRITNESFEAGGKGINVALILNRLGEASGNPSKVTAAGFTADFTGREVIRSIEADGLVSGFIDVPGHTRINIKITDGLNQETEINGPGPDIGPGDLSRLIASLKEKDFDTLFISGSLPPSCTKDTYALIIRAVLENKPGVRVIVDCEGETMKNCLPLKPFLTKPNASELTGLTGIDVKTTSSPAVIKKAASKLINWGAQNVIVSLGGNGACLLTSDGRFYETPGIKGNVVSTVGSGDTMIASFIYMLDQSGYEQRALQFANECAAATAFTSGLANADELKVVINKFS